MSFDCFFDFIAMVGLQKVSFDCFVSIFWATIRGWNRNKNEKGHGNASSRILMPIKFSEDLPAATEFRAHIKDF